MLAGVLPLPKLNVDVPVVMHDKIYNYYSRVWITCSRIFKLFTDNMICKFLPWRWWNLITNCSPCLIEADFHSSLMWLASIHKPYITIMTINPYIIILLLYITCNDLCIIWVWWWYLFDTGQMYLHYEQLCLVVCEQSVKESSFPLHPTSVMCIGPVPWPSLAQQYERALLKNRARGMMIQYW